VIKLDENESELSETYDRQWVVRVGYDGLSILWKIKPMEWITRRPTHAFKLNSNFNFVFILNFYSN
jgi:hypothetical protein